MNSFPACYQVFGRNFYIEPASAQFANAVFQDEYQINDLRQHNVRTIVDIGAHVGSFTVSCHHYWPEVVHDAFVRLVDIDAQTHWNSRGHFFGAAAEAMRRILVEHARRKRCAKHVGKMQRVDLDMIDPQVPTRDDELIALDDALSRPRFFRWVASPTKSDRSKSRPRSASSVRCEVSVATHREHTCNWRCQDFICDSNERVEGVPRRK